MTDTDITPDVLKALVIFVAATELIHDAIETWDRPKIVQAIERLYEARNIVHDVLVRNPE